MVINSYVLLPSHNWMGTVISLHQHYRTGALIATIKSPDCNLESFTCYVADLVMLEKGKESC